MILKKTAVQLTCIKQVKSPGKACVKATILLFFTHSPITSGSSKSRLY